MLGAVAAVWLVALVASSVLLAVVVGVQTARAALQRRRSGRGPALTRLGQPVAPPLEQRQAA